MYRFFDYYHNEVHLSFEDHPFSTNPKHVLVLCRYEDKWLLTKHSDRGYEFPGGKVEENEMAKDAAIREVKEETGGIVTSIEYIGQYKVMGKEKIIVKNIYFAMISELIKQDNYFETLGPVLLQEIPQAVKKDKQFSFIMKDDVLKRSLQEIKKRIFK
ncbi:RNA deprotection pyrophosphohydrolase [Metabacillus sediminilitoris]|jgi:8-oxo-dGTP diphosphatase|uniref:Nucleoside triphosphatase YtkD n=1 Tax=Metabacillus sediminilitoris TaxID=2567941 RepID=A0A4S4C4I4_9BACI|nr:nucleoside triphosphatase YtkD [Metabacillus sediminilitoris]QGQ47618.1 nucleoside triphosphatase YtkD [Metabacillus sediminilitoris]THF82052.1 nucleoside triphosphatase YtkD [Metabacillus sediminilitoris]